MEPVLLHRLRSKGSKVKVKITLRLDPAVLSALDCLHVTGIQLLFTGPLIPRNTTLIF